MAEKIWLSSPHMGGNELKYIHEAFDANWVAPLGPNVNGFEADLDDVLKVYPNPVSNGKLLIETAANAERTVAIYDLLGKNVLNTTTSNSEVNVASLNAGVYIVKITEEGNTTSRKLIIR